MRCHAVICEKPATWKGTLSVIDGTNSRVVAYCDTHAAEQIQRVPDRLHLSLSVIGQKVPEEPVDVPPEGLERVWATLSVRGHESVREALRGAWSTGYMAGWDDRQADEVDPLPAGAQYDTPNPYGEA